MEEMVARAEEGRESGRIEASCERAIGIETAAVVAIVIITPQITIGTVATETATATETETLAAIMMIREMTEESELLSRAITKNKTNVLFCLFFTEQRVHKIRFRNT
jgi:hypothetical protein